MKKTESGLGFWTIGKKLGAAFAALLVMLLVISIIGVAQFVALRHSLDEIVHVEWKKSQATSTMVDVLAENTIYTIVQAISPAEARPALRSQVLANRERFVGGSDFLKSRVESAAGQQALQEVEAQRLRYVNSQNRFYQLIDAGDSDQALRELLDVTLPSLSAVKRTLSGLEKMSTDSVQQHAQEALAQIQTSIWATAGVALAAFVSGLWFAWRITRAITQPIGRAVLLAEEVAVGNLNHHIEATTKDETGLLLAALGQMNTGLLGIVRNVRASSGSIATATSQISTGNMDLSSRTEEQASALEETASAMQEILSSVEQTLENTRQAQSLSQTASTVAAHGGQVVNEAVVSMQKVKAIGDKISEIVGLIEGIAFQTNILALNAAVEAARAGDHGRGFAVVASEVRTLASRSATASKEIKSLIQASVADIANSSALVEKAGSSMQDVMDSIHKVTSLVSEIAHSSQEQTSSLEQINSAVLQMDTVTQQNAALVEEGAAAAQSLESQAIGLVEVVAIFNTGDDGFKVNPTNKTDKARSSKPVELGRKLTALGA